LIGEKWAKSRYDKKITAGGSKNEIASLANKAGSVKSQNVALKTATPADVLSTGPQEFALSPDTISALVTGITTGNMAISDLNTTKLRNTFATTFSGDQEAHT